VAADDGAGAGRGHRTLPHTADLRIEAWAATREDCVAEAVQGLVDSFAEIPAGQPGRAAEAVLPAGADEDLLVAALDEVIYRMDADDELPASAQVRPDGGGAVLVLTQVPVAAAEIVGAVPKAVSLHQLHCAPDESGRWSATVTVDV
jgi:SHS2 domain-containing protein